MRHHHLGFLALRHLVESWHSLSITSSMIGYSLFWWCENVLDPADHRDRRIRKIFNSTQSSHTHIKGSIVPFYYAVMPGTITDLLEVLDAFVSFLVAVDETCLPVHFASDTGSELLPTGEGRSGWDGRTPLDPTNHDQDGKKRKQFFLPPVTWYEEKVSMSRKQSPFNILSCVCWFWLVGEV